MSVNVLTVSVVLSMIEVSLVQSTNLVELGVLNSRIEIPNLLHDKTKGILLYPVK